MYAPYKRWVGFGVKSGGQLGIGGFESITAYMINLGNGETFELQIINARWGLGLGGSAGAVAVLGFGILEPYELHGSDTSDWGVNIAYTEKLISKSTLQTLVFARHWAEIYKMERAALAYKHVKSAMKDLDLFSTSRQLLHTLMAGYEVSQRSGIVVLEVPWVGGGLELSAYVTRGKMYVSNSSDWLEPVP